MNKGTHFIGQPMYGQLINLLDKSKILRFSRENGDTDMGDTHSKPAAHGHAEAYQEDLELLEPRNHVPHHAHVLRQLLHIL